MTSTIAIDAMGGDHGPAVVVPAAVHILRNRPELKLILVGDQDVLRQQLKALNVTENDQLVIHHTSQQVMMDEQPALALRFKKDSSMRVAINMVKEGTAQACVSAGNTGALMATARFVLKTLPGIDRPAIIAALPTVCQDKMVRMLDLGANIDADAEQLFQLGVMGSVVASAVDNIDNPTVGLLNIGTEHIKGTEQIKQAAQLLSECKELNYKGFVEGNDIFNGVVDVLVCDGFVGNVALKVTEGAIKLISHHMKEAFNRNWLTKLSALAAKHALKGLGKRADPARYNGASLVGLQGIVIKSHGSANLLAFANAIKEASVEIKKNIPQRIRVRVSEILQHKSV